MKKRLITNGILSLFIFVSFILMIVGIWKETVEFVDSPKNYLSNFKIFKSSLIIYFISLLLFWILSLTSIVMGIVTLSMEKHPLVKGLTIASGILAILGGLFGANAIVSFIAANKIKNF